MDLAWAQWQSARLSVDGVRVQQQDDRSPLGCESEVLDIEQSAADVDA
jgi:hypothetical protein